VEANQRHHFGFNQFYVFKMFFCMLLSFRVRSTEFCVRHMEYYAFINNDYYRFFSVREGHARSTNENDYIKWSINFDPEGEVVESGQ